MKKTMMIIVIAATLTMSSCATANVIARCITVGAQLVCDLILEKKQQ